MPPRFAYWTILIDNAPTAFRAASRDDLLPTLNQLRRKNADVVMKWFARGRLWESPEAALAAAQAKPPREKRNREWRPGGDHRDPRARFDKNAHKQRRREARRDRHAPGDAQQAKSPDGERRGRPWRPKPGGPPRPWKPQGRRRRDDERNPKKPGRG